MPLGPQEGGSAQLEEGHLHHKPAPLGQSHWASPSPNPAREDVVIEGDMERKEGILKIVWRWETEMPVLERET